MLQLEQGDQLSATFHLQRLLQQSAQTHRSLLQLASATAVDVPPEAALTAGRSTNEELGPRVLQWSDYVAAGAADWQDFDDEGAFLATSARLRLPPACVHSRQAPAAAAMASLLTPSCQVGSCPSSKEWWASAIKMCFTAASVPVSRTV